MTIQWRTAYDHYGDAVVAAGEALTLEIVLMVPDGEGWAVAPLQDRTFIQRVINASGSTLAEVEAQIVDDEGEANFLRFSLAGDATADLMPSGSYRQALRHEIAEIVADGRDVLHCGDFTVERFADPTTPGEGVQPSYRYVLQQGPSGRLVAEFYRTRPGPAPRWDLSAPNSFTLNLWTGVL